MRTRPPSAPGVNRSMRVITGICINASRSASGPFYGWHETMAHPTLCRGQGSMHMSASEQPTRFGQISTPDEAWLAKQPPEPILDPDLPIIDPHHHLWDRPQHRYLLDDFLADVRTGHPVALRGAAAGLELLDKRRMLWRLQPLLQCGDDLAAIASEQGWGIEPEPREYTGFEHPTRVRLHVPIRAVLQDKPAHHAL